MLLRSGLDRGVERPRRRHRLQPVAHRERGSGRSHYGVWNRVWKGLRDVRAVRWMWKNRFTYVATERPRSEEEAPEDAP